MSEITPTTPSTTERETVLFVGGHFDGRWLPVNVNNPVWVVADDTGTPQVYIGYHLGQNQEAKLMLHQSLSPMQAILKLVAGYHPERNTDAVPNLPTPRLALPAVQHPPGNP